MGKQWFVVVAAVIALGGCASGVKRAQVATPQPAGVVAPTQFASVSIAMTPEAKEKAVDNLKFNQDILLDHVKRALEAKSLIGAAEKPLPRLEVLVTSMRVRSNFSAVIWGFMAGADSIDGDIVMIDPTSGKEIDRFSVSASYALGGLAGGQDETRMGWLYEKFAEETVKELAKQQSAALSQ